MIYEIRDYTIEKEWLKQYVKWVKEFFLPYAKNKINIIDFWAYDGIEAEVEGKNPVVSPNWQPNITWVAKYNNKQERDDFFASLETDQEWKKCGVTIQILMHTSTKMHVFLLRLIMINILKISNG